jgi:enoyl-CoA hydratase/carnithine racemase
LGAPFNAARASELGLVTSVVPEADVLPQAINTAQKLAQKPTSAMKACKALMKRQGREDLEKAATREIEEFAVHVRSAETKEAIAAFFEKRPPDFAKAKSLQPALKAS